MQPNLFHLWNVNGNSQREQLDLNGCFSNGQSASEIMSTVDETQLEPQLQVLDPTKQAQPSVCCDAGERKPSSSMSPPQSLSELGKDETGMFTPLPVSITQGTIDKNCKCFSAAEHGQPVKDGSKSRDDALKIESSGERQRRFHSASKPETLSKGKSEQVTVL